MGDLCCSKKANGVAYQQYFFVVSLFFKFNLNLCLFTHFFVSLPSTPSGWQFSSNLDYNILILVQTIGSNVISKIYKKNEED